MPKLACTCKQLVFPFFLVLVIFVIVLPYDGSDTVLARGMATSPLQNRVPEASKTCSLEESTWWKEVRAAAFDAAVATARKQKALAEANNRFTAKHGFIPGDEKELFSQNELVQLNEAITVSKEKYLALLRDGAENHIGHPLPMGPFYSFNRPAPDILMMLGETSLQER
jgi:hypothetical protein